MVADIFLRLCMSGSIIRISVRSATWTRVVQWTLLLMEPFLKAIKDRPEAQTASSGLPHQSFDQGAAAIGFHFSNPIFFVYHSELPRLPYCNSQPNSIKLPLPWRNILSLCSRVSVPSPSDFLQNRIISFCFLLLRLCPDNENQRRLLCVSSVSKSIWYVKRIFFVCVRE